MIISTKFYCKTSCSVGPRSLNPVVWTERFIKGKWYDGEYETWTWKDGYKCNNGWRKYWVTNESGVKEEISRSYMHAIFQLDFDEVRDQKINDILNKDDL
jgi:hypothetical protein